MNKLRLSERLIRWLAFILSGLLYAVGIWGLLYWTEPSSSQEPGPVSLHAVKLQFVQIELQAAVEEPPPPKELEPPPPEEGDVVLEERVEEPEVEPEPMQADARVTQDASAVEMEVVDTDRLVEWVSEQIQKEKYYPKSARRAGYEGTFSLLVKIEANGVISEAIVVSGRGHPLLRRSLEKIMRTLPGRCFDQPLEQAAEIPFEFNFDLQ